ncbi:MAG: hypothetical protein SchgKO_15980 [Schleiferiaceae bacterium]
MKNAVIYSVLSLAFLASCDKDDDNNPGGDPTNTSNLTLDLNGLEDLGSGFAYEGWIVVDGSPVSTGVFTVDEMGHLSETVFAVNSDDLANAEMFVLSIEPSPDSDPAPAATKLLAGAFSGETATMGTDPVGMDFGSSTGEFIVAAPTGSGDPSEEFSGVWFLEMSSGMPMAGLDLPMLADGWKYEGWVVVDGVPISTGTFTEVDMADEGAPFSGPNPGPPFPGEDFLVNPPSGVNFPVDLRGKMAVISIEPYPDNSDHPFTLKPLVGPIPATLPGGAISMDNMSSSNFPTGSVSR